METRGPRQSEAPDARRTRTRRRENTAERAARSRPGPRVAAAGPTRRLSARPRPRAPRGLQGDRGPGRGPHTARPAPSPAAEPPPPTPPPPRPSLPAAAAACSPHDAQARRPPRALRRRPPEAPRPRPAARPPTRGLGRAPAASGWRREPGAGGGGRDGAAPLRSAHPGPRAEEAAARPLRRAGSDARTRRSCALAAGADVSRQEASRRPRGLERPGEGCGAEGPRTRYPGWAWGRRGVPESLRGVWGAAGEHSRGRRGRNRARNRDEAEAVTSQTTDWASRLRPGNGVPARKE